MLSHVNSDASLLVFICANEKQLHFLAVPFTQFTEDSYSCPRRITAADVGTVEVMWQIESCGLLDISSQNNHTKNNFIRLFNAATTVTKGDVMILTTDFSWFGPRGSV